MALDGFHGLAVVAHAALQTLKRIDELRLLPRKLRLRILVRGVDHGAGRQHERHGLDGVVGVELRAARHAGGVVGNHASQGRRAFGGRVRSDLAPVRGEVRVDLAHRRSGLDAYPCPAVEHLHPAEVLAHVHEHARAAGLAGQRGAAGAQHHRCSGRRRGTERGRHVVGGAGLYHHVRGVEEVGRVVGVLDPVDRAGGKRLVGAEFAGQMLCGGGNGCGHKSMLDPCTRWPIFCYFRRVTTIEIRDLNKRFGSVQALDGMSFTVHDGEMYGFVGSNGAGKSTTMRIALGVLAADSGEVLLDGRPLDDDTRRRIGYMPEERGLYGKEKILDQLVFLAKLHGVDSKAAKRRGTELLEELGLGERVGDKLDDLSLGNQQRVLLAASLIHDPDILILDEPLKLKGDTCCSHA